MVHSFLIRYPYHFPTHFYTIAKTKAHRGFFVVPLKLGLRKTSSLLGCVIGLEIQCSECTRVHGQQRGVYEDQQVVYGNPRYSSRCGSI